MIPETKTESADNEIRKLARMHGVTSNRDSVSCMAVAITRLAGDTVILDEIEQMLVNLKKKGVLNKSEIIALQGRYLRERRPVG